MRPEDLHIDEDIRKAATLPAEFYRDSGIQALMKERVFATSWQFVGDTDLVRVPGQVHPFTFLEGYVDEPLLLTRDSSDNLHCLSNVCTHRGNILVEKGGVEKNLRCRYHGRKFGLDGCFLSMPECEHAIDFPTAEDNLASAKLATLDKLLFASIDPAVSFESLVRPMLDRVGWLPLAEFKLDPSRCRDYLLHANWALYCDNYLEGFHIPYVHAALNDALDYSSYRTEIFPYCNLQVGVARGAEEVFDLPESSPDHGSRIAAYYFWLFPNTMLNFYPWGLSINVVKPLSPDRTKVSYITYVWKEDKLESGAGKALDRVEREDEAIVENVQRGVRSRLYKKGRFSPKQEKGTHHFHRLLSEFIKGR